MGHGNFCAEECVCVNVPVYALRSGRHYFSVTVRHPPPGPAGTVDQPGGEHPALLSDMAL